MFFFIARILLVAPAIVLTYELSVNRRQAVIAVFVSCIIIGLFLFS